MVSSITFRGGGETVGSVADRKIETAKQETTGGVGARINQDSVFTVDNELKQDEVCFRGAAGAEYAEKPSATKVVLEFLTAVAAGIGLFGLADKYDWVGKIGHQKTRDVLRHTDVVTKPCHDICKWVKNNCYKKVLELIKKAK